MDNSTKVITTIVVCVLVIMFIMIGVGINNDNKKKEEALKQRVVADVIMIEKTDKYRYTIVMDGYEIQTWTRGKIRVKIDPHVRAIKAKFTPAGNGHYHGTSVILTFVSKEEAKKVLGDGYLNVNGNNNVIVQNKNKNKGSCFISAVFQ